MKCNINCVRKEIDFSKNIFYTLRSIYICSFKLNLVRYIVCVKINYVKVHYITIKAPTSQILIGLETSLKSWQIAKNVNI